MNTLLEKQNDEMKQRRKALRKRAPSMLDPFTEQLFQMEAEKKTIDEMLDWLKEREVTTARGNLSHFLTCRREEAELQEQQEQLQARANKCAAFEELMAKNPKPDLGTAIEMFKLLTMELAASKVVDPGLLALADRLGRTAVRFVNDQSRAEYRTRKLVMEEAKHAEWLKDDEARALELCLKEADKHPEVGEMFTAVFVALKKAKGE